MGKKKAWKKCPRTRLPYTPHSFDLNDGSTFWVSDGLCIQTVALNDDGSLRDLPQNAACCAALDGDLADLGLPQTFGKVKPQNATNHPPTATLNGRSAAVSVPVEWQQLIDPDTESVYYYNPATKESRWDAAAPFDSTIETTASPPQQPADNLPAVQPVATQRAMTTGMFEQGLPSSPNPLPGQHVVFDRSSSDGSHSEPQLGTDTLPAQSQPLSGSDTLTDIFPGAPLGKAASPGAALADLATSRGVPIWPVADPVLASYWKHRHHLFSRFDQGILIDREGWFSVTPEFIAAHQATALLETPGFVVDLGCCVGGNTVQLAAAGNHVLAVDVCAPRLALAAHNAEVYGVRDRVTFVAADMREMESWRAQADAVFVSPPWGGCGYKANPVYGVLNDMGGTGMSLPEILHIARSLLAVRVWRC